MSKTWYFNHLRTNLIHVFCFSQTLQLAPQPAPSRFAYPSSSPHPHHRSTTRICTSPPTAHSSRQTSAMSAFGAPFGQQSSAFGASSTFGSNPAPFGSGTTPFGGAQNTNNAAPLFGSSQPPQQQQSVFGGGGGGGGGAFGQSAAFGGSSVFGGGNNQAPVGGGAFGGSSAPAFGASSTPAFGGSAFGANPQQQQQQPGFGGAAATPFGAASSSAFGSTSLFGAAGGNAGGTSLFGGGGGNAQQQQTNAPFGGGGGGGSVFGQSQPAWGANSSSAFGAAATPFGGGAAASAPLFGAASSSSLFGGGGQASGGAFGSTAPLSQNPQQGRGTAGVNWSVTTEYDSNPGTQSKYQAISMMQQLRDRNLEELRVEDYASGNKDGTANNAGAAAGGSLFGAPQPAAQSGGGLFGASSSAFGQAPAFGSNQNSAPFGGGNASSGGGLFGGGGSGVGGGLFGNNNQQSSGGGLFGSSAFGAQSQAQPSGGGLFGSAQSSATPFGSGGGATNTFGSSAPAFGGQFTSSFQSQPNAFDSQQPSAQSQSLFGNAASSQSVFGAAPNSGGSIFGAQPGGTQSSGGLFGAGPAAPNPSPFGNTAQPQQQTSLFGNAAPPNTLPSGGLFSGSAPATNTGGFGLFGASAPAVATPTGGSFFGANNNNFAPQQPTAVPANVPGSGNNPSLIDSYNAVVNHNGATIAPPGANFGTVLHNLQKLQDDVAKNNRLIEEQSKKQTPVKPADSMSIVVLPTPRTLTFSANQLTLGGGPTTPAPTPATTPAKPRADLATSRHSLGPSAHTPAARATPHSTRASLGPFRTPVRSANARARTPSAADPTSDARSRASDAGDATPFFTPRQFSGARRRTLRASEVETPVRKGVLMSMTPGGSGDQNGSSTKHHHIAEEDKDDHENNDDKSVPQTPAAAERGVGVERENRNDENTPSAREHDMSKMLWSARRPSQWSRALGVSSEDQYDPAKYLPLNSRPDYYTEPSVADLAASSMTELQHVRGFTVGRRGIGSVRWMEPVDVRGLVLDDCVHIERGDVSVLPDRDASQLDAPARITLEGMRPKPKKRSAQKPNGTPPDSRAALDKYEKSLRRFCEQNALQFVSYDAETAVWVFETLSFRD